MATSLSTIVWNILSMKTYVIWLKLHWHWFTRIQCTICLHLSSLPGWVLNVSFFKSIITNKISTEIALQGNLPFPTHLPDWYNKYVPIYKHNLIISINILRRRKFIHMPDKAHFIVLYSCVSHRSVFFRNDEIKILIIIIIYALTAAGWRIHASGI